MDVANKFFVHAACQMHGAVLQIAQFCFKGNPLDALIVLSTAEFNMELLRGQQQIKLRKK